VYDPLEDDENFQREAVIHGDGEYVDGDAHVNTCEASQKTSSRPISEPSSFVGESYVNPVKKLSKRSFELCP